MHERNLSPTTLAHLERQAVAARRRAFRGDVEGALATYRDLAEARNLEPRRRLWLLARYAETLRLSADLARFETLCSVVEEMESVWRTWQRQRPDGPSVICCRRQMGAGVRALLATARRAGHDSGIGRAALGRARSVLALASR